MHKPIKITKPDGLRHLVPVSKGVQVWREGYSAQSNSDTAILVAIVRSAITFEEAIQYLKKNTENGSGIYEWKDGTHVIWGCRLFDNEQDARKSFG